MIGSKQGLSLLDRSGDGKVFPLISKRRFKQLEVLESLGVVITVSGKRDKVCLTLGRGAVWQPALPASTEPSFPVYAHSTLECRQMPVSVGLIADGALFFVSAHSALAC